MVHSFDTFRVSGIVGRQQILTRAQTPLCEANWINATGCCDLPFDVDVTHSQSNPKIGISKQSLYHKEIKNNYKKNINGNAKCVLNLTT